MRGVPGKLGRGLVAYVRLVAALRDKPMSAKEIRSAVAASPVTAQRMTRRLLDAGILSVREWRDVGRGPLVRVFGYGKPRKGVPQNPPRRNGSPSRHCGAVARCKGALYPDQFIALWKKLASREPMSAASLGVASSICDETLNNVLREARARKLVRIAAWHCGPGERTPLYCLGAGTDEQCPPRLSNTEISRRYRVRRAERRPSAARVRELAANASIFNLAQSMRAA